ncbi:MAG: oxygen-independent coproporphyrinogen III oxidase [Bacteroidetes bacterium]|nr:oxygen-independent coproporphyrinogen III oxidase [Bacteroidota bacterium]
MLSTELIQKYNVQGPRYTSYPTVPYWSKNPTPQEWIEHVQSVFRQSNAEEGISLYIHLPYCESLCTFCACNKRITINHAVEKPYIEALLKEWNLYLSLMDEKPIIKEIHLGGGTPTFFQPENLHFLLSTILNSSEKHEEAAYGFEAHPKNTSKEHLSTLYDLGFRRLSLGIQDFDPEVQRIINRVQPFEMVEEVVNNARAIGYESINFDLIYGLPKQNLASVEMTIDLINRLVPDRIAFYSYAHVPWIKGGGQRLFTEADLPKDAEKRQLYETGKQMFEAAGYVEIGMDHFAKKEDDLSKAMVNGTLHRNFMGYTTFHTSMMIGLGASSISDMWTAFAQNEKKVEDYIQKVTTGEIPFFRGHILTNEELVVRQLILDIMCQFETEFPDDFFHDWTKKRKAQLMELEEDGLIELKGNRLKVTEKGKAFVRNICMIIDDLLWNDQPQTAIFSKTI